MPHMPSQSLKTLLDVIREGQLGIAINGNVVIVIKIDELTKFEVTGQ